MDPFTGEIRIFAGTFAPNGWHYCDGSTVSIASYQALFSLIGTTYGGDGVNNFGLPDLRGRLAIGTGAGPALTPRTIASKGGSETVTLTVDQIPQHNHSIKVSKSTNNNVNIPSPSTFLGSVVVPNSQGYAYLPNTIANLQSVTLDASVILPYIGASSPHLNVMPVMALNYIICLNGIYPTPS